MVFFSSLLALFYNSLFPKYVFNLLCYLNTVAENSFFFNYSISNHLINLKNLFLLFFSAGSLMQCALLLVWLVLVYSELLTFHGKLFVGIP